MEFERVVNEAVIKRRGCRQDEGNYIVLCDEIHTIVGAGWCLNGLSMRGNMP